jgi:copper chaperone CopZ|tara:strand:+ start:3548 stop:4150 length:603 start_codon:yes stop_codon:yes gene_type:complete
MGFSCPHCAQDIEGAIPKDRFDQVNTKKNEAEAALATKAAELATAQQTASTAEALTAERDKLATDLAAAQSGHEAYRQITAAGISAEVVDGFSDSYSKLGDDKPATVGEWVSGMQAGTIEPPALLKPHLPANTPPAAPSPPATSPAVPPASPPTVTPPPANVATQPHPHAPDPVSADALTRMTTADYKAYKTQQSGGAAS